MKKIKMDISSLLNNNLKLKQIVCLKMRQEEILDMLWTNLLPYLNEPIIIQPVQPDIPGQGVPSDFSVSLTQTQVNYPHRSTELLSPVPCQILKSMSLVSGLVMG